ncbi:MAG: co-chaperone DjlA [Gammaproteobacteria bacterium SHHR-1]|uniref:co-chaperone DjlA n=1 Tax=Magnetovirga frankeli TaxID=947516 RepID=UPI00129396EA|nr:co-chaperone DjlA [gamma proteobacterium SS-5]
MAWWGKLVGSAFGLLVAGPLGALLGAALGHRFDKGLAHLGQEPELLEGDKERVQMAFFTATFSVMGAVAKSDGHVTREEIALAESVIRDMELNPSQREIAIRLFNEGKSADFPLDEVIEQLRRECRRRKNLLRMFIEIQLQGAYADGALHPAEEALLLRLCRQLGLSELSFRLLRQRMEAERRFSGSTGRGQRARSGPRLEAAYQLLGLTRQASEAEIKRAYRRLMSQHHPDKLVSKGLPEEMIKVAEQKTIEIKQAYEQIKAARGLG